MAIDGFFYSREKFSKFFSILVNELYFFSAFVGKLILTSVKVKLSLRSSRFNLTILDDSVHEIRIHWYYKIVLLGSVAGFLN